MPLFSLPESVPHSFVLFCATQKAAETLWYMAKRWADETTTQWDWAPHWVVSRNAKRSKRSTLRVWAASEVLGKHCKVAACLPRSLVLGRARERILLLSSSTNGPLRQGVWAATTTMQLVRRMKWRPPLLHAYLLGHRILDNLKNH